VSDRSALITGSSSGIGLAIARALGEEGFSLTVSGRRPEKLEGATKILRDSGFEVHPVLANVAEEDDIARLIDDHGARFGRLNVLVNNAGIGIGGNIEGYRTNWIDRQLAVDLRAVVLVYREALPWLRKAVEQTGTANVVNLSSITGKGGREWLSVYSAAKAGVVGFTEAMNRELGQEGILSCALCPAYVDTALSDYVKDRLPGDEMIRVEDVAEAVRFLVRLSRYCLIPEIMFRQPGVEV
jgi:NAD(P)-dependent dehydrogenase (short-subunit alcohol dehydrogenase family)